MANDKKFVEAPSIQPTGQWGENLARDFLEKRGLRHVASNWRCKAGEIDLIMQDKGTRVFVEVRTRKTTSFGAGLDTVASQKQRKILRTALWYQRTQYYWGNIRFDVVSIEIISGQEPVITHIPHAF